MGLTIYDDLPFKVKKLKKKLTFSGLCVILCVTGATIWFASMVKSFFCRASGRKR